MRAIPCLLAACLIFAGCLDAKSLVTTDIPRDAEPGETTSGDALASDPGSMVVDSVPPEDSTTPSVADDGRDTGTNDPGATDADACSQEPAPCHCLESRVCPQSGQTRCLDGMTSEHCVVIRESPLCLGWTQPIPCDDKLDCTDDSCDDGAGICRNKLQDGWCLEQHKCARCE